MEDVKQHKPEVDVTAMKFKVGQKVVFNNIPNRNSLGWQAEPAIRLPYLTICEIDRDGNYHTVEIEGAWSGCYWELYIPPVTLDEDLFTL